MFNLRNFRSIFIKRRKESALPKLSPTDKQIVSVVARRKRPTTVKEILKDTGGKRRNVYNRLSMLVERGIFKSDGVGYTYVGPKAELRVTPFIGAVCAVGVGYAYATNKVEVMFFSFVAFIVSIIVEATR